MIQGRTVQVSSGGGYTGVFHQWVVISNNNLKAVVEKDGGTIELEDPNDVTFVSPVVPLDQQIKQFQVVAFSKAIFTSAVLENGEEWVNKVSISPKIESVGWTQLTVPYQV